MTKKEGVLNFFLCAVCAAAVAFSLAKPAQAGDAAFAALSLCARRVVPGIFLFMAAAKVFAGCGGERLFARATFGALEKLFGVSRAGAAVIFLGLLSGYPAGAAVAGEYIKAGELSRAEAERILPFATAASPAFLLGSVGAILGGVREGALLLAAQFSSAVLLLLLTRTGARPPQGRARARVREKPLAVLTRSLRESGLAVVNICSFVTFFYVFSAMLLSLLPSEGDGIFPALLAGALEISCGFAHLAALPAGALRSLLGGLVLGFGGFSVFLQSADALACPELSMKKYLLGKALQALATAVFAALYAVLFAADAHAAVGIFLGEAHARVAAMWEICAIFLAFSVILSLILIFLIKILTFFKKIFKKLWKKNNL